MAYDDAYWAASDARRLHLQALAVDTVAPVEPLAHDTTALLQEIAALAKGARLSGHVCVCSRIELLAEQALQRHP